MAKQKETLIDRFANRAYATLIQSAINTLSFVQINTGINIHDKVAWVIHRIGYDLPTGALGELQTQADTWQAALTVSDQLTSLSPVQSSVIDRIELNMHIIAAGTGARMVALPIEHDFTNLPGGGHITPAAPLYVALQTAGFVAVSEVKTIIDYSIIPISSENYWDLVEATRVVT